MAQFLILKYLIFVFENKNQNNQSLDTKLPKYIVIKISNHKNILIKYVTIN